MEAVAAGAAGGQIDSMEEEKEEEQLVAAGIAGGQIGSREEEEEPVAASSACSFPWPNSSLQAGEEEVGTVEQEAEDIGAAWERSDLEEQGERDGEEGVEERSGDDAYGSLDSAGGEIGRGGEQGGVDSGDGPTSTPRDEVASTPRDEGVSSPRDEVAAAMRALTLAAATRSPLGEGREEEVASSDGRPVYADGRAGTRSPSAGIDCSDAAFATTATTLPKAATAVHPAPPAGPSKAELELLSEVRQLASKVGMNGGGVIAVVGGGRSATHLHTLQARWAGLRVAGTLRLSGSHASL